MESEIIADLKKLFFDASNRAKKTPLYESQIQRILEAKFHSWEVSYALKQVQKNGAIYELECLQENIKQIGKVNFYYPRKLGKDYVANGRTLKKIKKISKIVRRYASKDVTAMLGKHLYHLVRSELRVQNFEILDKNTNSYNGKKWESSEHTLDIIAEHKNKKFAVGVEIKNSLDLIPMKELNIKLEMCKHLGIVPVFACRWLRPFYNKIYSYGGFPWEFKTQIYPLGQEKFVKVLQKKLNLPVEVMPELPQNSVENFQNWLKRF